MAYTGKESLKKKKVDICICICITDSLCYTPETNKTVNQLYYNEMKTKKKERKEGHWKKSVLPLVSTGKA